MPRKKKTEIDILAETLNPLELLKPSVTDPEAYDIEFVSADEYGRLRAAQTQPIISGTPLDDLIKTTVPGFQSMTVYDVWGANETGKTQTCDTLAVLCPYDVVWIDGGEDTFSPPRIAEIAEARGYDPKKVLEKIHFQRALNASHLEALVTRMPEAFMKLDEKDGEKVRVFKKTKIKTDRIGLIILDSLTPLYRVQYQGLETLVPRQQALLRVIYSLRIIALWMNCVVVTTNQVIANPSPYSAHENQVGGFTVGHNIDVQIKFRRSKHNMRIATLTGSSNTPLGECVFYITKKGIESSDETIDGPEDKPDDGV